MPQQQTLQAASASGVKDDHEAYKDDFRLLSPVQCKLAIGAPDDPLENEADAMADKIMRMPEQNFIQRKCADCQEEEKVQTKPMETFIQRKCDDCEKEDEKINRKPLSSFVQKKGTGNGTVASESISDQIQSGKGNGSAMDDNTMSFMQNRFGLDFSDVKIHTNDNAVQMNRDLNAKAFTVGKDIYFNEGQYQPGSFSGKQLLAHELTHTLQQGKNISRLVQRKCSPGSPAADEAEYITGSGKDKMAYNFSDEGGADAFIKKNPGKNLVCHPTQKGSKTVYAIYQKSKPGATAEPKLEYPKFVDAEIDLDLNGSMTSRELHLSIKLKGKQVAITFSHVAGTKKQVVTFTPDNIEITKDFSVFDLIGTDGVHPLEIHVLGMSKKDPKKADVYFISITPNPLPGLYGFNLSRPPFTDKAIPIDLGVPSTFSDPGFSLIEEVDIEKKAGTWKLSYRVGPNKELRANLFIIKDPDNSDSALCYFSMTNPDKPNGIQTDPSKKMRIALPDAFEHLELENLGTSGNTALYGFVLPYVGPVDSGFMVTYETTPLTKGAIDSNNAEHGLNLYPINKATKTAKQSTPAASFYTKTKNGYFIWDNGPRTTEGFRIEAAKHAYDKLQNVKLPPNEIASLQDEISLIVMMAVKEKISSAETFTKWMEFSYGVIAFGQDAAKGDETAKNWLNTKADAFISSLINDIGRHGDTSTFTEYFENFSGYDLLQGQTRVPVTNKYTGESYDLIQNAMGAPASMYGLELPVTTEHKTAPFENVRSLIATGKYEEAMTALRESYYLWVQDQLINNKNTDDATKEKFKAYGYQLSYRRQLRKKLSGQRNPLRKIKALYYPDLGNITNDKGVRKNVASEIIAIPLDLYYQDSGDEWTIYNFTSLTKPGELNDFKRTGTKYGGEEVPTQEMFDLLAYDEGLGEGYIIYHAGSIDSGIVRVNHPWTLGGVLLGIGAVLGLIALALTGVGLLAEGAAAVGLAGAAAVVGDIAAITIALGASVKLGQDYLQGKDITAARIGELALDITTAILPAIRTMRGLASLRQYKGLYIIMDNLANSRVLAKLNAGANITAMVVTSAKGAEELTELKKALDEGRIDEATFYWAVFRNVSFGIINVLMVHQDLKTLSGRSLGNTNIDDVIKKGFDQNILDTKAGSMYSRESLEAGITIMQESSSVYRIAVLEALGSDKGFREALEILCYIGKKGRGAIEDVVIIDGKVRRAVDVLAEAKLFGKVLPIPQGFTGSKGEALDAVPRDFSDFSKKLSEGVRSMPDLGNAEIHIQGSTVMGVSRPKPDPKAANVDVPSTTGSAKPAAAEPKWDIDVGILIAPADYSNKIAGAYQNKAKKDGVNLDLSSKSPQERIQLAKDIQADDAVFQAANEAAMASGKKAVDNRKYNAQARGFANSILTGKANMSSQFFPELAAFRDKLATEFNLPKMDLSIIEKGSGFESSTYLSVP